MAARKTPQKNRNLTGTGNRTGGGGDMLYAAGQHFGLGIAAGIQKTLGSNWPSGTSGGQSTGTTNMPARAKRGGRRTSQAQT